VLVGDDDDRCAMTATVDPAPVTQLAEVIALLAGCASYELIRHGKHRVEIHHRDEWRVHSERQNKPIVLEHRCPGKVRK
jgi:hypothetical protein